MRRRAAFGLAAVVALAAIVFLSQLPSPGTDASVDLPGGDAGGAGASEPEPSDGADAPVSGPEDGEAASSACGGETGAAVSSYASEDGVAEEAGRLLDGYEAQGDCVLREAGYLDLFGRVWTCTVQGPGWVDMCFATERADQGGCEVRRVRLDAAEWRESYEGLGGEGT